MTDRGRIEFIYEYQGFAAIKPFHPDSDRKKYVRRRKKTKEEFVQPEYPRFPLGVVVDTKIEDIRHHGVRLQGEYKGKIRIELTEIKHGGRVVVGSLDYRDDQPQQFLFQIRQGRRYHDIWMGMPIAIFKVTMDLTIPDKQYHAISKTNEMLEKVTPEEVAKLELENTIQTLLEQIDLGLNIDDTFGQTDELDSEEKHRLEEIKDWLKKLVTEDDLLKSKTQIEKFLDETSEDHRRAVELRIESLSDEDLRKKWARQLGDMDQDLLKNTKQSGKEKRNRRVRRRARRDLKILKKSDNALEDIFKIFRFYMNTYLSSVKYLLGQYWMQLIPEWEVDYFYSTNEVNLDDSILVRQPMYSMGSFIQYAPSTNIVKQQWSAIQNLNFGQMMALSTGFTAEGIFVKAYEALRADEAEVCIVLLDIGLEFAFRNLTSNLNEEGKSLAERIRLPDTTSTDISFGEILASCQSSFERMTSELRVSRNKVRELWAHIQFIHRLRNSIIHRKTIIRKHISLVLNTPARKLSEDMINPNAYRIDLEVDPENVRHVEPYWWRVINQAWYSAYDVFKLVNFLKWGFLSPNEYNPPIYPTFRYTLNSREIVFNQLCKWLSKIFRVRL